MCDDKELNHCLLLRKTLSIILQWKLTVNIRLLSCFQNDKSFNDAVVRHLVGGLAIRRQFDVVL